MEKVRKYVPEEEQKIDLSLYWKILWRKKFYLVIPIVLSLIISFIGARNLTPIYLASTLVSVEERNILSQTMGRYLAPVEERQRVRSQQYRAMIEARLKSRTFLEMIVREMSMQNSYEVVREFENAGSDPSGLSVEEKIMRHFVGLLKNKIEVRTTMPGFYSVNVFDTSPGNAHRLAAKITNKYIEVTQQAKLQGLRQAGAFSDEQLAIYKEKLEGSEKELSRVQRELAATDVETNPVNMANVHIAEARKRSLAAKVGSSEIALRGVRERLLGIFDLIPSTERISRDESISNLEEQLIARSDEILLTEISGNEPLVESEPSSNPLWIELRRRISEIVQEEYSEFSADIRPLITEYFYHRYLVDHYKSRENWMNVYIERFRQNMQGRPQLERERNRLNHEVETNRAIYEAFLQSKTSTQITEAVQSTNLGVTINVVEKAEKPLVPVKPDKMKIILVALIFGLACGGGTILITEYMDDSFRTIDEVQRTLKVPVLGTVPKTVAHFEWERKKRGKVVLVWIVGLFIFVSLVSGALYMYAKTLKASSIGIELQDDSSKG